MSISEVWAVVESDDTEYINLKVVDLECRRLWSALPLLFKQQYDAASVLGLTQQSL